MWFTYKTRGKSDTERIDFLISVVRWLVYTVIALIVAGLFMGVYLNQRRQATDNRNRNLACIALKYTPPNNDFHRDLRKLYPHCPQYLRPKPTPRATKTEHSTVTHTVGARHPQPTGVAAPAPTVGRTPTPTPSRSVQPSNTTRTVRPGPTATVTRVVPSSRPVPTPTPTQTGQRGLLPVLLCPVAPPIVGLVLTC